MEITKVISPNQNSGRHGWEADTVVCHITEGGFNSTVAWITNPASQVSYHYVVARDGSIVQAVELDDTAWANGTTTDGGNRCASRSTLARVRDRRVNANLYTVSIGFEGRTAETQGALAPAQLAAAVRLIRHIRGQISFAFDREHIVGHSEINPVTKPNCPGAQFPFGEVLEQLRGATSTRAAAAWEWGIENGITDGSNPQGVPTREQVVRLLQNFHNAFPV